MTDKNDKYSDLMNRALDGDLSAEEQSDLEEYLETDSEARAEFRQLSMTGRAIGRIPMAEPPSDLKNDIMAHIISRRQPESARFSLFDGLRDLFRRKIQWRYVYTFSAGAVLGIFILAMVVRFPESSPTLDPGDVSGTISRPVVRDMVVTDKDIFEYANFRGAITVREGQQAVLLAIDLQSEDAITVDIGIDKAGLRPVAIWQPQPYRGAVTVREDAVWLNIDGGTSFEMMFQVLIPGESDITCRLSCGNSRHEAVFTIGAED